MASHLDSVEDFGFSDPENARNYSASGPEPFVPGFAEMHRLTLQLLTETAGESGTVLVLGAGGGHEVRAFSKARPDWKLIALDPSPAMLNEAKQKLGSAASGIQWIEGYIDDAPTMQVDAATCLLTLHVIPDDETKLETLKQIRARMKPDGCFALVDNCIEIGSADANRQLNRFVQYAVDSGIPRDQAEVFRGKLEEVQTTRSHIQEEPLLKAAGFKQIELYYVGLSWRGWIAKA